MNPHKKTKIIIMTMILLALLVFADKTAQAQMNYPLLESFPGFFDANSSTDLPTFILAIYKFGIWTVGIAGLLMLTVGGFMYMTSAGNTSRVGSAKGIITDAIIGIIAALAAYLIMWVINPDLTQINIGFAKVTLTEKIDKSDESTGSLDGIKTGPVTPDSAGTCGGLKTQNGIFTQCVEASPELSALLSCIAGKDSTVVITSISDSALYPNCIPTTYKKPPCHHSKYSCHYGGSGCYTTGKSYAADLSTRDGMTATKLIAYAKACGANYTKDEAKSANHVHVSVGAKCGCK